MYRPSKHLVVASEDTPAIFRPSNQMRLVSARPANPQLASSMLPGMGHVQSGNGVSSMGLQSKAADRRLAHAIAQSRLNASVQHRMAQRSSGVGQLPEAGMLQVSFAWAADSIAATRQKIIDMYGLQPIKGFGHLQTYVTSAFGTDMEALQDALCSQPIVRLYDVQPYLPQAAPAADLNAPPVPTWEHVRTQQRPDGSRWITTKLVTPSGTRFAVTLYRTEGDNDVQVVRSDNLATDTDATSYIQAYEVKTGDIADAGHAKRTVYWNSFLRGNKASGQQVDSVNGKLPPVMLRRTAAVRDVSPVDGLGELAKSPLVLAACLFAGVVFLAKYKPSH